MVMVTASERIFWYYTDATPGTYGELAFYYSLPVYALFWFLARYRIGDWASMLVALPIFGYVVEGVMTPVMYSGGPLPFFPVWFTAWHGGLGVLAVWLIPRRLLVTGRTWTLAGLSAALGVFWGTWATTMWLPENLDDPELAESMPAIRSAEDFALYAAASSLAVVAGHWLLGRIWVSDFRPSRWGSVVAAALCLIMVGAYTAAIPWALPMFVVLVGAVALLLRRHLRSEASAQPTIFQQLSGPIRLRSLVAFVPLPVLAASVYAMWEAVAVSETVIRAVFHYGTIWTQTAIFAVAMIWSMVKVARRRPVQATAITHADRDQNPLPGPAPLTTPGNRGSDS